MDRASKKGGIPLSAPNIQKRNFKRRRQQKKQKNIFERAMAEYTPKLMKTINLHIQGGPRTLSKTVTQTHHSKIFKDKEKILKVVREKNVSHT
jgi:hypothetical protein